MWLLQDTAPVNISGAAILDCGFQQIYHLSYSPGMVPSDYYYYYMFSYLKNYLRGWCY